MYTLKNITIFVKSFCLFLFIICFSANVQSYDFNSWSKDAAGHKKVLDKSKSQESPMVVYFYISDSEWCQKFNDQYLSTTELDTIVSGMNKVIINYENGPMEKQLYNEYNAPGFPAFYVHVPGFEGKPERIHPFDKGAGIPVDTFVEDIQNKIVSEYSKAAKNAFDNKEFETALKYFDTAITYDPKDTYILYGKALSYHGIAYRDKNKKFLELAEKSFQEVLKVDPNHAQSKESLDNIQKSLHILRTQ